MEFLKLPPVIDPSYYRAVGISLGIPCAQQHAILVKNEMNYINAFMDMLNAMQQSPHSNKQQLLADKLREIYSDGLLDEMLNEFPNPTVAVAPGTACRLFLFAKWLRTVEMTEPVAVRDDTPSASGQTHGFGDVLNKVADNIPDEGDLWRLAVELGIAIFQIHWALKTNSAIGVKTSIGTGLILRIWAETTKPASKRLLTLRAALKRARLFEVEKKCFTSSSRGMSEEGVESGNESPVKRRRSSMSEEGVESGNESLVKRRRSTCKESNVLCDLYFSYLAEKIGSEWRLLGIRLGLNQAAIDHIAEDKLTAVDRRVALLQKWKNQSSCPQKRMVEELCQALSSCGREDLAGDVKEAAGIS